MDHALMDHAESFFRSKLGDVEGPTAPFGLLDAGRPDSQTEEAHQQLEPDLSQRVRAQAHRLNISAATLFHACWALVVARTSGQDDVVYGTVLQGSPGGQRTSGMPINTLPLRLSLKQVTTEELVKRTQRELMELLAYRHCSLQWVQRCSGVPGSTPLLGTLLDYRKRAPGQDDGRGRYPIVVLVDDLEAGFRLTAQTDRRVDPQRIVTYMRTGMQSLVGALEQRPQTPALSLSILPESERRQLLELFNATQAAYPQEKLVHVLFEEQVQRTAGAVAVVYEGRSLTYAELNGKANQLARHLRGKGIGPDQLVGICVERSPEMVVGLLGVLKAGGAYVPLDPAHPPERLQYMLQDASPRVLLTQRHLKEHLPPTQAEVIALDEQSSEIARQPVGNLETSTLGLESRHLAYVIYTSGSTGKPKGVLIEHAGLSNYLQWALRAYGPERGEATPISSPLAFDATVTSLYCPLLSGRAAILLTDGHELDGLVHLLQQSTQWSLVKISPAHLQVLGQRLKSAQLPCSVGAFVIGGEALSPATVELWRSIWPQTRLINEYGPTETVVGCCVYEIPKEWAAGSSVPIGRPIANTRMYILDPQGHPVPIGVVGEIYIGGAGVARGYLSRPELTAARFLQDPFHADSKSRMYKTGDLGRWRADGNIEYLGRNDLQVKIRGFRIELGEIEAQLLQHLQVKEAVVLAREDEPGKKRLVAYVVPRDSSNMESALGVETLRALLKPVLPDYMIPSVFLVLKSLPLTANGKLDRRALPAPERSAYENRDYEAPQGEIEELLARSWQILLRVERVGRHDNFFVLGGDSLLGSEMVGPIANTFKVEIPFVALFRHPTIEQFAGFVEELRAELAQSGAACSSAP